MRSESPKQPRTGFSAGTNIYFTDPALQSPVVQDDEHVYHLPPDRSRVSRVIRDMVRPNGIVGTADGKTLYVANDGAGQTFVYDINSDGTLSRKRLFVSTASDGMTLDAGGNSYLTTPNHVQMHEAAGTHLRDIPTQENPTNVTPAGCTYSMLNFTSGREGMNRFW